MTCATCVGSRETQTWVDPLMFIIGWILADKGIRTVSGGAVGPDGCFEAGARSYMVAKKIPNLIEIHLPKDYSNGRPSHSPYYHTINETGMAIATTVLIDSGIMPWIVKVQDYVKKLHCRNVFEVLTVDMTGTDMLICFAKEDRDKGTVGGGTRSAVLLARHFGIPVFNLAFMEDREMLFNILGGDVEQYPAAMEVVHRLEAGDNPFGDKRGDCTVGIEVIYK